MVKSLKELALDIVKGDPIWSLKSWRIVQTEKSEVVLRKQPEPMNEYVDRKLAAVQFSWSLQGKYRGTSVWFSREHRVRSSSAAIISAKFNNHFRNVQFWKYVFGPTQPQQPPSLPRQLNSVSRPMDRGHQQRSLADRPSDPRSKRPSTRLGQPTDPRLQCRVHHEAIPSDPRVRRHPGQADQLIDPRQQVRINQPGHLFDLRSHPQSRPRGFYTDPSLRRHACQETNILSDPRQRSSQPRQPSCPREHFQPGHAVQKRSNH
ncbi:hypothetical protein GCK72_025075 [Caenorhabditis remanei]|uniref:Uncharacterized protein n=1 Tax=Caenorhabditis remanei TaxID=31234 RepID=E3NAQ3_CAERE|nr:hypothetical protein GCK72_025075 [Caenorhabditis remanei]EFO91250.1 hypothetical protein CRE_04269 [Caenorhabditis remanei]KAF1748608.1 hypothetical protein GCK72_025075 [Caenorhabditis remanei]